MRKVLLILSVALLAFSAQAAQKDTLRILAIGNSFSQDAVNENFGELCVAAGKHVIVGNLYIGGCSLERHYKSLTAAIPDYIYHKRTDDRRMSSTPKCLITKGIFDEPWDIVTFQQASSKSGKYDSFEPFLGNLVAYVRENVPTAKRLMWHQTWAYHLNSANGSMKANYGDQAAMYKAICEASAEACRKYGLEIIPSGTAIQDLRTSYEGNNCHRDGSHLSYTIGRYTAACTWFEAIFKESVVGNAYGHPQLEAYRVKTAQNAAHLAAAEPYAVTNMRKLGFDVPKPNYDESKMPPYTLPDPLVLNDGSKVRNKKDWMERRRPEILSMFETEMFGKAPSRPEGMTFEVLRQRNDALGGKATCKEVRVHLNIPKYDRPNPKRPRPDWFDLIVYTPNKVKKAPVFLGINFKGNHAISDDGWITKSGVTSAKQGITDNAGRGEQARRWPLEEIIDAGYGVATFYRGDVAPDYDNSYNLGVIAYMKKDGSFPAPDEWGNIGAWAWSLSRALDYLETDADVDAKRVAVIGHSRLGKTALWAGATDPRFAMVISSCSGCCGAALSRRRIGETVETINMHFPYWFCKNFQKYNGREDELPFDQHELLALIAPRPLYVASASLDKWADPKGEGLSLEEAKKVYRLFGAGEKTGRHVREGKHDIVLEDWRHYIDFADKYL